jgi:hypothetical protein
MAPERRTQILILGALVALLAIAAYLWFDPSAASAPTSNGTGVADGSAARTARPSVQAPDVHLPALQADRPKPVDASRNLFRFKPKPPPPPPPVPKGDRLSTPAVPTGPPPAPTPPPITLKYIGYFDQGGKKVAVLADELSAPVLATEGDTVLGRYRVLRIGVESLEIAYLDGSGRRTIRLTGS